jgi:hypothetical protein
MWIYRKKDSKFTSRFVKLPLCNRCMLCTLLLSVITISNQLQTYFNKQHTILISPSGWMWFAMVIAAGNNVNNMQQSHKGSLTNLDVNFCKNQHWVCNMCGEEFQHVGRTIFIKSKMLLFPYTLINSTQIFEILTF